MIFVTGDTHGDLEGFKARLAPCGLSAGDVLVITGDFGFDWNEETISSWQMFDHPYTVLFCDGNHENYDVLGSLPLVPGFGDVVGKFDEKTFRLLSGHMYEIEKKKVFVFGGASSIDRDWRVKKTNIERYGKLWWKEEIPSKATVELARETLEANGWRSDLFISHTCPPDIKHDVLGVRTEGFVDPVEHMLLGLEVDALLNGGDLGEHWFGHFHIDRDLGRRHCTYERVRMV